MYLSLAPLNRLLPLLHLFLHPSTAYSCRPTSSSQNPTPLCASLTLTSIPSIPSCLAASPSSHWSRASWWVARVARRAVISCSVEVETSCFAVWQCQSKVCRSRSGAERSSTSPAPNALNTLQKTSSHLLRLPFPSRLVSLRLSCFLEPSPSLPLFLRHSPSQERSPESH